MSRHHLIFEANVEVIRVRDVGSANGTFVNEARINNLELCAGDRIRAGLTTFEVSVLGDDEDPHKGDGIPLDTFSGISLGSTSRLGATTNGKGATTDGKVANVNLTVDESVTNVEQAGSQRVSPQSFAADNNPTRTVPSVTGNQPATAAPASASPTATTYATTRRIVHPEAVEPIAYTDDVLTLRCNPLWWASDFQPSSAPCVYTQRPESVQQNKTIVDVLKQAYAICDIVIIVNRAQLDQASELLLTKSVNPKLVSQLSRTLCLIRCDGTEGVWNLLTRSLRKDAFICLGVTKQVEASWLNDLLDCICYPSMLGGLVQNGDGQVQRRLLMHANFALFEKSRSGDLCLLLQGSRGQT